VEPAGARGPIYLNGEVVRGSSRPLEPGDVIMLLGNALAFVVEPPEASQARGMPANA
jgi:hypothetical protein